MASTPANPRWQFSLRTLLWICVPIAMLGGVVPRLWLVSKLFAVVLGSGTIGAVLGYGAGREEGAITGFAIGLVVPFVLPVLLALPMILFMLLGG